MQKYINFLKNRDIYEIRSIDIYKICKNEYSICIVHLIDETNEKTV